MSGQFPLLVTSHSDKQIHIWNLQLILQNNFNPVHIVESPLRHTTSTIACFASGKGYAVGSIEGRVGVVKVDLNQPEKVDASDFCFKCHRKEESGKDPLVYTVNALAFNKAHDTFATAGSDGFWVTWNKDTRSRYKSSGKSGMPITAACFSKDAQIFIHAHGEDWTLGAEAAGQRENTVKLYARSCELSDVYKKSRS